MRLIDILLGLATLCFLLGGRFIFTYVVRKRGYEKLGKEGQSFFDFLSEYYEWSEKKEKFRLFYNSKLYLIGTRLLVIINYLLFIAIIVGIILLKKFGYNDLLYFKF